MENPGQHIGIEDNQLGRLSLSRLLWPGTALFILLGYLYLHILRGLVYQWWTDPNYSHGFLVPVFSGFLIWKDRKRLSEIEVQPAWWGLLIVLLGLCILTVGTLGAELYSTRLSLLFILAGLIVYFGGLPFFRAILFPWLFLFLMVPPPTLIMNMVTIPLQFLASDLATWFLRVFGVPVLQNGNVLELSNMSLQVVQACSGIRSLISLGTLAIIYGYLLEESIVSVVPVQWPIAEGKELNGL